MHRPVAHYGPDTDFTEGRRGAGKKIMDNVGLKPYRNKINRNPRLKLRKKFDKATVRRKGQVREYAGKSAMYGGEKSGIKSDVTHSTKL